MRFIRTVSVKHHPTGDHYQLSIPSVVAQALDLQDGGLVSIKFDKFNTHKKGHVQLQAYRDSEIAWREQFFDPLRPGMINKAVAVPPRTLGPSKPWGCGKIIDWRQDIREVRLSLRWMTAMIPCRRGRRRRRWH